MANDSAAGGGLFGLFPQNTNTYALNYLSDKYGQAFSYLGPWGDSMTGTRSFLASCDTLPGQRILVQVKDFKDKDNRVVLDNYLACRYAEDTVDFIRACAKDTLGAVNVYYEPALLPLSADLPADATFERFLSEGGTYLSMTVEVKASAWQNEEQARAFAERVANTGVSGSLNLIAVKDEQFGTLTWDQLKDKIALRDYARYALASCSEGSCRLSYREGTA